MAEAMQVESEPLLCGTGKCIKEKTERKFILDDRERFCWWNCVEAFCNQQGRELVSDAFSTDDHVHRLQSKEIKPRYKHTFREAKE